MATEFQTVFEYKSQRFQDAAAGLRAYHEILSKDWDGSAKVLSREMVDFLTLVTDAIATRNAGGWPGGTTDGTLSQRTGELNEAILGSVRVTGTHFADIQGTIGAPGIATPAFRKREA